MLVDQVDTLHISRYWSDVLCCTIMAHQVKVMGHGSKMSIDLVAKHMSGELCCHATLLLFLFAFNNSNLHFQREFQPGPIQTDGQTACL